MRKNLSFFLLGAASLFCFGAGAQNWVNGGNVLAANGSMGTNSNHALIFKTNNLDRGRITNGGNWGIGTASPVGKFHVYGVGSFGSSITAANATRVLNLADANAVMRILRVHASFAPAVELISRTTADGPNVAYWDFYAEPSDKSFRIRDRVGGGSGLDRVTVKNNGYVGIGTTAPSNELHVVGRGRFTNGLSVEESGIYSNHSAGNGVEAYGNTSYGSGVYGSGYYGVNGNGSLYGLYGQTSTAGGWGAVAYGGYGGAYGSGTEYGLYGYSTNYGVYGYTPGTTSGSAGRGVQGYNAGFGHGVSGFCESGSGIYGTSTSWYAGWFDGDVYSSGNYVGSDRKLKQNIEDLTSAMDIITKLQPKIYDYKQEGNFKNMHLPKGKHFGLIAQELEQVLPNLVREARFDPPQFGLKEDPKDKSAQQPAAQHGESIEFKAVNYSELIPIVVKALQEQQQLIDKQQRQNNELLARIEKLESLINKLTNGQNSNTLAATAALLQNVPNPAKGTTAIQYSLPEGSNRARLVMTDALGRTVRAVQLTDSGVVNLDVSSLSMGVYNYSLVVDGKTLVTKKMTVQR